MHVRVGLGHALQQRQHDTHVLGAVCRGEGGPVWGAAQGAASSWGQRPPAGRRSRGAALAAVQALAARGPHRVPPRTVVGRAVTGALEGRGVRWGVGGRRHAGRNGGWWGRGRGGGWGGGGRCHAATFCDWRDQGPGRGLGRRLPTVGRRGPLGQLATPRAPRGRGRRGGGCLAGLGHGRGSQNLRGPCTRAKQKKTVALFFRRSFPIAAKRMALQFTSAALLTAVRPSRCWSPATGSWAYRQGGGGAGRRLRRGIGVGTNCHQATVSSGCHWHWQCANLNQRVKRPDSPCF